jgi:hypothetical protein
LQGIRLPDHIFRQTKSTCSSGFGFKFKDFGNLHGRPIVERSCYQCRWQGSLGRVSCFGRRGVLPTELAAHLFRGWGLHASDLQRRGWRRQAAEMRAIADGLSAIPIAQAQILRIAEGYDQRAERIEERLRQAAKY